MARIGQITVDVREPVRMADFWSGALGYSMEGLADDGDAEAEVRRLLDLGASPCDVGQQGDEGFTVLADPEGNAFCVLDGRVA